MPAVLGRTGKVAVSLENTLLAFDCDVIYSKNVAKEGIFI